MKSFSDCTSLIPKQRVIEIFEELEKIITNNININHPKSISSIKTNNRNKGCDIFRNSKNIFKSKLQNKINCSSSLFSKPNVN